MPGAEIISAHRRILFFWRHGNAGRVKKSKNVPYMFLAEQGRQQINRLVADFVKSHIR